MQCAHPDCFARTCIPGHITGSVWRASHDHTRFLLTHHRKLNRWLQLGGHSDGNPNPVKYAYNVGLGGKGLVPGRPRDTFGIGWARTQFSDDFVPFLRERLNLGLSKEDAVEMYYNFSITPAINATLDLQIVDPALRKTLNKAGDRLENIDTAVIAGLRIYARF